MKRDVDGLALVNDLEAMYRRYTRPAAAEAYPILATWVLHCHAFPAFTRTPYIHLTSPAPECGKTTVLEITELLVPNPWMTMSITNAVLARKIDAEHPVLLLDEVDNILKGDKELVAAIRGTINSGYKKSGKRTINEPVKNGGWQGKDLSTYCPKMFSGIDDLPDTVRSRCIPIVMERLGRSDRVEEIDEYKTEPEANLLLARCQDWAAVNLKQLRDARPDAPAALGHRQREVCRPLLAIADLINSEIGARLREALVKIFTRDVAIESSDSKLLALAHVRDVIAAHAGEVNGKVRSADLCEWLIAIEDGPWSSWGKSRKPISQNQLARQLKGFAMPGDIRTGQLVGRGYQISALERAFDRYLPPSPLSNRYTATDDENKGVIVNSKPLQTDPCSTLKNEVSPLDSTDVAVWHFEGGDGGNDKGEVTLFDTTDTSKKPVQEGEYLCNKHGFHSEWGKPNGYRVCLKCEGENDGTLAKSIKQ